MKKITSWLMSLCLILLIVLIFCDLVLMYIPPVLMTSFWVVFVASILAGIVYQHLIGFFIRRLVSSFIVLFIIATATFLLLRMLPGGPFDEEKALPPAVKANIEKKYGLDKPLLQQYTTYMAGLLQGNLGYSYKYEGRPISETISNAFPISFKLGFYALLVSFLVGVPLGLIAASKYGTRVDSSAMILAISGISLPSFVMAPILIYLFSYGWPLNRVVPEVHQWMIDYQVLLPAALWSTPRHYILPVITLGIRPAAFIARLTRTSVLDVINSDFVRTARAKGLSERVVLYRHVLRNSLIPVLTYAGPLIAGILSGSFVIEIIFNVPGIAKYFVQSVFNRDYPLIMGLTLLYSVMLISANFMVDVLYKVVDPRIEVS